MAYNVRPGWQANRSAVPALPCCLASPQDRIDMTHRRFAAALLLALLQGGTGCERQPGTPAAAPCPEGNGGLRLPDGFCADIVADNLGFVRQIAAGPDGRLYVTLRNQRLGLGGLLMLTDREATGRFTQIDRITDEPGLGIGVHAGYLYFGADTRILRFPFQTDGGIDAGRMEVVVDGFPSQDRHPGKALAIAPDGSLYVNVGAPNNACQAEEGVRGSAGLDPCPFLEFQASVWRFDANRVAQKFPTDGKRHAAGIRNAYAMAWHQGQGALFVVQHGRDGLHELWPDRITETAGADLPAEEFLRLAPGSSHGWPYCYYDPDGRRHVLAPEYGGDGVEAGRCAGLPEPVIAFPAHYGPNAMLFYGSGAFPARYAGGAFIAFHGSYNRGPYEQVGYQVAFVPLAADGLARDWEVFADGFAGSAVVVRPEDAEHRPTGLALAPDGSLYVSDSVQGTIWRIWYTGVPPG
jgi:glucose/arabinose dehydrogenase